MARLKRVGRSPAVFVAVLALVAAVGGTALADSGPTANSAGKAEDALKQAKKALKKAKKNKKAIKNIELTPGAQGPQGEKGDPVSTMWAHVDADGADATLLKGSGVDDVDHVGMGAYTVTFSSSVSGCGLFATLSHNANLIAPAGEIGVAAGGAIAFVDVRGSDGMPTNLLNDEGFMLMALC